MSEKRMIKKAIYAVGSWRIEPDYKKMKSY